MFTVLEFRCDNSAYRPVMQALDLLRRWSGVAGKIRYYDVDIAVPLDGVVPKAWRAAVVDECDLVERIPYEVRVLVALRDAIRRHEIYVVGAERWRNPEEDLPRDFDTSRDVHYAELRQPLDPAAFIVSFRKRMTAALTGLDQALVADTAGGVRVVTRHGEAWISVPKLERLDEVIRRWGALDLLDVLKDADFLTEFTAEFSSVATREVIDRSTLRRRRLLCLFALDTNIGIRQLVDTGEHGQTDAKLRYVRRHFITRDNRRCAITTFVSATLEARDPAWWCTGTACASDSKKFSSWESNLMTKWHNRHGGPGVMIYWHVERISTCIYSQLRSCSSSDVAAMIEGLLRHCTSADIEANYVDTHGASVVGFAFTEVLGFRLLPRLKNIGSIRLYWPSDGHASTVLGPVLTRPIRWELIAQQYDQMIKYATPLQVGTAESEWILRRFTYQALEKLGGAHAEVSMLALHLLQSALVHVNTMLLQNVLDAPGWAEQLTVQDRRGLSPLFWSHINPYGRFRLDMDTRLDLARAGA